MSENWLELAIIGFITAGIAFAVWKGGQANPEGTGSLGKRVARIEGDLSKRVARIEGDIRSVKEDRAAMGSKLDAIEHQVQDIERRTAKASDIERLERQIAEQGRHITEQSIQLAKLSETLAAVGASGDQRGKQLDRLYDFIVQKGMNA